MTNDRCGIATVRLDTLQPSLTHPSVFLCQHDSEDVKTLFRIGWIFTSGRAGSNGITVDLPEDLPDGRVDERHEVVFTVRIVVQCKPVVPPDCCSCLRNDCRDR